jgi:hypothetical protein
VRTEVCITIDIEYSIAGAFSWPERFTPLGDEVVKCVVDGQEQGLGFILDGLRQFGLTGTFFTEALQTIYFGDGPMGRIVERIAGAGHDVQLHLHPCWLHFRDSGWRLPGFVQNDVCAGRTDAELDEMIRLGMEAFSRWGIARPVALRAGGFLADRAVYRAMARAGLNLASNIGLGVFEPAEPELRMWGGRHLVDGVLEVPSLSYRTPALGRIGSRFWRTLAITATSRGVMEALLWAARRAGVQSVVILTHPFEFVKKSGFRFNDLSVNRTNQERFLHLVDFLRRNNGDFATVTFGERRNDWLQAGTVEAAPLQISLRLALLRGLQNALNDFMRAY